MYTRVLTYDLKYASTDDYENLYKFLTSVNAKKLTESSYLVKSSLKWDDFKEKIRRITKSGDKIKAVVLNSESKLDVFEIR